jgi:hypothetical protein
LWGRFIGLEGSSRGVDMKRKCGSENLKRYPRKVNCITLRVRDLVRDEKMLDALTVAEAVSTRRYDFKFLTISYRLLHPLFLK